MQTRTGARPRASSSVLETLFCVSPEPLGSAHVWGATRLLDGRSQPMEATMHGLIYLVGLIVVILAVLSFFGLR